MARTSERAEPDAAGHGTVRSRARIEQRRHPQTESGVLSARVRALRIKPNQAVFLDDLGINLKPAKELGMTTIKVTSEDQAIAELSDVLRIDFKV